MSDSHDVPVRPVGERQTIRRSWVEVGVVALGLTSIVAFGLLGPRGVPTPTRGPAQVAVSSERPVATSRPTPAVRDARLACLPEPTPFDPAAFDLTGVWTGVDGGVYYLSQLGSVVWWNGMSDWSGDSGGLGAEWSTVGHGTLDGLTIALAWADLPRGIEHGSGTLDLEVQDNGQGNIQIVTRDQSGGFGNTLWLPAICRSL